ncbi:DUF2975 domain-containing protein [Ethanoligenens sp.]|uniref:DUF2975 domain-containing protein n=1 Tax=Ethanoligenens sp. TaxID=2099655 RepID=UPI0039E99F07
MKLTHIRRLAAALTVVVIFLIVCDVLITASASWWLKSVYAGSLGELKVMLGYHYNPAGMIYPLMLAFFIISGLLCLGILIAALHILRRIRNSKPFCLPNARSMQHAAYCGFGLCIVFLSKLFFSPSILTFVCAGIFLLFGLFLIVLAALLHQAVELKDENELTI